MADLFRFNPDLKNALDKFNGIPTTSKGRREPTWADVERAFSTLREGNVAFASRGDAEADPREFRGLDGKWRREIANDHDPHAEIADDSPFAAVLCCSDHRASPELIFWQGLGRLFVVREAGNLADDSALASLEYAVAVLKVPLIVILGHEGCGAVQAAIAMFHTGKQAEGIKLPQMLERFRPAWETRPDKPPVDPSKPPVDEPWLSAESIERTKVKIGQLPLVKKRLGGPTAPAPNLEIVTGRYDLLSGLVTWLDTGRLPLS